MATIDLRIPRQVNFLTVEKDFEKIIERIFSNQNLLKLLYYTVPDALDKPDIEDNEILSIISERVRLEPHLEFPEVESPFLVITFDDFSPNDTNIKFMDNFIYIDVLVPTKLWRMDSYMSRPYRIMHELQQMLDKTKLNGIGVVNFVSANLLNLGLYSGFQLAYKVINDV